MRRSLSCPAGSRYTPAIGRDRPRSGPPERLRSTAVRRSRMGNHRILPIGVHLRFSARGRDGVHGWHLALGGKPRVSK